MAVRLKLNEILYIAKFVPIVIGYIAVASGLYIAILRGSVTLYILHFLNISDPRLVLIYLSFIIMMLSSIFLAILLQSSFVRTSGFKEQFSRVASEFIGENYVRGRIIKSMAEWSTIVNELSDQAEQHITSLNHVRNLSHLKNIVEKLDVVVHNRPNLQRTIIFTVPKASYEQVRNELVKNNEKWEKLKPRMRIYLGELSYGVGATIVDYKHWFFSASSDKQSGILVYNCNELCTDLNLVISNRWIENIGQNRGYANQDRREIIWPLHD